MIHTVTFKVTMTTGHTYTDNYTYQYTPDIQELKDEVDHRAKKRGFKGIKDVEKLIIELK